MSTSLVFAVGLGPAPLSPSTTPLSVTGYISGEVIPLTGAMTYTVDLAMMPAAGLQGLVVTVDRIDAYGAAVVAPVRVTFTGGFADVKPGGGFGLSSPGTVAGITSLTLTSTANALVRVTAGG